MLDGATIGHARDEQGLIIKKKAISRDLVRTLQALYESEIQVTIAASQNSRFEFCVGLSGDPGHVESALKLADALHEAALKAFPESRYALGDGEFQRKRGIRLL